MKIKHLLIIACLLVACRSKPAKVTIVDTTKVRTVKVLQASYKISTTVKATGADTAQTDEQADAYANYYIVVADTGTNYYTLRAKMFDLNRLLSIPIDTMERSYNKAKDLIALSDKNEDEMYAGEYFPRRYPSKTLSLEYLDNYRSGSKNKTIALVTGIYENKASADSALQLMGKPQTAFAFKARVYIGCMH